MNAKIILILAALGAVAGAEAQAAGSGGASGLPSTSRPAVNVDEAYADGVAALQAKDYAKAEKKFGAVLSVAPAHPEANYYMALSRIGAGNQKGAVKYLEKAIKARGNFVEARERLALVGIGLGDLAVANEQLAAIRALKDECAASGDCDPAYTDRVDRAIDAVTAALGAATASGPPAETPSQETIGSGAGDEQASLFFAPREKGAGRYVAAVRLINQQRYEEAIAALVEAQTIAGPHPDILNYLGYSHRKLGRMAAAQDYYAKALAIDPDHKGANEYLGELYLEIGNLGAAKAQLARLDRICVFGCAEREDLARLIARREGALAAR